MNKYQKLYDGIGRIAWGYFFVYFDFKFNSVSVLPSFIGYLLFLSAISLLCDEERELDLLKSMNIILVIWHLISWLLSWVSADPDGMLQIFDIVIGIVNIYFHFQLLTNVASIASRRQPSDYEIDIKLLNYRTVQTVMLTIVIVLGYFSKWLDGFGTLISVMIIIGYIIAGILLMKALFDLRRVVPNSLDE